MNLYEKMNNARVMVQEEGIKKNGKNTFAKYDYWKLADINPVVNKALKECRLCSHFQIDESSAILTIIDVDNPQDVLVYTMPFINAEMSKVSPIQAFGATVSYLQRYLLLEAFQIGEPEIDVDSSEASKERSEADKGKSEDLKVLIKEVQALCQKNRAEANTIVKGLNNGSIAVTKIESEEVLLKIKEELLKL